MSLGWKPFKVVEIVGYHALINHTLLSQHLINSKFSNKGSYQEIINNLNNHC